MFSHYVHSVKKVLTPRSVQLYDQLWPAGNVLQKRDYLPASAQCENAWNQRLTEDLVKKIGKPSDFYMKMLQKMKTEFKIWPLDLDLYIHSLESESHDWHPHDVLEILKKYRRAGGVSLEVLESTQHTVLRLLLAHGATQTMLSLLCQPERCGVFLDDFTATLLMDHFLEKEDYASSSVIATRLMLIEKLDQPLTNSYALLSCLLYFKHCIDIPNIDYTHSPAEPPETVLLRIDNYQKPYIDHDLETSLHKRLVGKTLALCGQKLSNEELRLNCCVVGWTASHNWAALRDDLCRLSAVGGVSVFVKDSLEHMLSEATDEQLKKDLLATLSSLNVKSELDVVSTAEAQLKQCISESHTQFVTDLESLYKKWANERQKLFEAQCEAFEKAQLVKSIKEKKKKLKKQEELLYFFDREIEMDALKAKRMIRNPFPRERPPQFQLKQKAQKAMAEKYIPPSMVGGKLIKLPVD
ncbi:MRPS27/PTCD2 [Trinorchestia longiramus]|nr:MRPS27/PTCD2 [Trinorchestia longiramus]